MGQRTISTRIVLEGDDEYRSKLSGIDSELKTLSSNMKLVDSDFRGQANTTAALTAKHKALQDVYAAQKEKVATLSQALQHAKTQQAAYSSSVESAKSKIAATEAALEKLKSSTGDTSDEEKKLTTQLTELKSELAKAERGETAAGKAANNYQRQLNDAKVELNDLDDELKKNDQYLDEAKRSADQCTTSIDKFGKQTKEAADSTDEAANKGSLLSTIFKGGFFANIASSAVSFLTSKVKEFASSALESADELERVKDESGFTVSELQKMQYVGDDLGVSLETQTGALKKLINNMESAQSHSGSAYEAFKKLGVSFEDGNKKLLNSHEVYEKVLTALGKMTNETERDAVAQDLMGKSATDLNPLIVAGGDAIEELGQQAEDTGAIMSDDAVSALDSFGDSMDHAKQTAKAFVGEGLAAIISGGKSASDQIGDLMTSFQKDSSILALIDQYRQLDAQVSSLPDSEGSLSEAGSELSEVQEQLINSSGGLVSSFNLQNGTFSKQVDVLEKVTKAQRDYTASQLIVKIQDVGGASAAEKKAETYRQLQDAQKTLTNAEEDNARIEKEQAEGNAAYVSSFENWSEFIPSYRADVERLNEVYAQQSEDAAAAQSAALQLVDDYGGVAAAAQACGITVDDFNVILSAGTDETSDSVDESVEGIKSSLNGLIDKYNEAKTAAQTSLDNTISGWTVMDNTAVTSAADAEAALQSQITWLTNYDENLKALEGRQIPGVDMGPLIQSLSDGSTQGAALLAGLATASDEDVKKIAQSMASVSGLKEKVSGTMAEGATNFSKDLDGMMAKLNDTVKGMDKSSDLYKEAMDSFQKYADGIKAKEGACDAAAQKVASSMQAILNNVHVNVPTTTTASTTSTKNNGGHVSKFANGTDFSPDMFIAGENGPELVMGRNGSKIWTAQQTAQLLSRADQLSRGQVAGGTSTVVHTGVIRVEGVNNQGDFVEAYDYVVDQLRRENRL